VSPADFAMSLGTAQNPLRVAVIGSGPSGFYAAESLLKAEPRVTVDMFERLPAPYGLVRNGVAPDHPKLKQAIEVYDGIAQENADYRYFGNVTVGRDVTIDELRETHHALIFCSGAESDRRLGIPGEDLAGSHTATEFVGWYNGHPDYQDREFDLSQSAVAVIGQGNVAVDVCRILSKTVAELETTDISARALAALAGSAVKDVYMIGRRGPAQAKFTHVELRELGRMEDCEPVVTPGDLDLNAASEEELADRGSRTNRKNMEILTGFAEQGPLGRSRRLHFHFLESPVELKGSDRVEALVLEKNRLDGEAFKQSARGTGETYELPCGLVFRSIGYKGVSIGGLPFDDRGGVIPNQLGRITDNGGAVLPGLYTAGWIKRGPTGIIGTNRADAVETIKSLLEDLPSLDAAAKPGADALQARLAERNIRVVSYADWKRIDAVEIERGAPAGKPREKFTAVAEMLEVLG
jgi:ferredoxin--NADP+ reductase